MPNFTFKTFKLFKLFFLVSLFFVSSKTRAQFPYSQSFKNSTAPGVLFGGSPVAFLTGGAGARDGYTDANGSGYLRLTNNQGNQKGIVYSDAYSFPSAYGMTISFEYFTHSKTSGSGADGIAFILFDATASPVSVGAFGGSLGYAQRNTETGFSKGYLGVGIDEYGNFSAANEGKTDGVGVLSSNVTLRGAGTGTTGYRHLISSQTTVLASPFNVAGNDRTATDNTKAGYRKMEVVLRPRSTGGFFIDVYLTRGNVRDLIIKNYAYTDMAPSNLKFAISSSTGGSNNFHEIRNLNITVDQSTLLTPVANADEFTGCMGLTATSGDVTANDNGAVNTLGSVNKATVDLDPATAGIQTSYTVANTGTFTYNSTTGAVTFTPLNSSVTGPVTINYTFNDNYNKTSNTSTITYKTYNAITNNVITEPSQSTFCTSPSDPALISGSAAAVSGGTITYQWESSTDNITFNTISGATSVSYDPPSTSTTTYYRRIASSVNCKNTSNIVAIVFGKANTPTATAATAVTCNSFTANWNNVPNAASYGLSVSTNSTFSSHVGNFDGRNLTSSNSYTVTGLTSGQTYYFKVWSYNSCGVGDTASNVITVTVGNGSVAGTASAAQTICSGTSPADLTLTGYTGTIQWQSSINNSTFNNISGATSPTLTSSQMGSLSASTYYRAVVMSGSCTAANTSSVLITVSPIPVLGTPMQSAVVCDGSTARINLTGLLANSTSTISYSIDGAAQTPVTGITADASGTGAFDSAVLSASNNGKILKITAVTTTSTSPNCTSTVNKDVTLNVNAPSVGGSISSAQTICSGTSPADLVLSGNTGNVTKWQKASDAAFTSPTDIASTSTTLAKATIGNLAANTYFRAIVQNGVCSAAFSGYVLITVNATPSAPTAPAQTFCSVDAKKVNDLLPTGSSYKWYSASSGGTLYGGTETLSTGTYYVSQTANGCESSRTAVTVTVNTTPAAPSASAQVFCSADSKKVSDLAPSGASYKWYNASNGGTLYLGTETLATGTYYVSQTTNGCESSRTAVTVTVNTTPAAPTVGTITQPTCSTATGSFTIVNYIAANTYTITPSAGVTRNAGVVTAPEGNYTISATANGCTSSNASFTINSQPATPAVPTVGTITQPTCSTATGSFTIENYSGSNSYTITPSAGVTRNAGVVIAPEGNYTISTTANGCTSSNASFTINAQPATPATPTIGTIIQPTCSTATGSFTITNYNSSYTYLVSPSAGVIITGNTISVPSGSYVVEASVNGCESTGTNAIIYSQICAVSETLTPAINGLTGGDTTESLIVGDKLNNVQAVIGSSAGQVLISPVAIPTGFLINADGTVKVPANTKAGNYNIEYIICEVSNTSNCSTGISIVQVTAPIIDAVTETTTAINGNTGGTTVSFTANDTLNGNPFTVGNGAGEVTFTLISTLPAGLTLNADRTITVAQNTPKGNYNVEYRICDNNNSGNCDTVISIVTVTADTLIANTDAVPSVSGSNADQTLGTNVFTNDTKNGSPLNPSDVNLTVTTADPKGYLTLDSNGNVVLGANAPAGDYELTYTICEKLNTSNCSSNTVKVTVTAPIIDAVTETTTAINGNAGGTTVSLTANDTLNGNPFTVGNGTGEVTFTLISTLPAGLTLNADRTITVAQNTPKGNYNVEYRICDNNNSGNCDTVTSIVVVTADALIANTDTVPSVSGSNTNQTLGTNVFTNDTKSGSPLNPSDVNLTVMTADPKGYLTLDSNGNVVLGANAPAGDYELTYTICEKLNTSNCSSNTVKVTVTAPIIDAVTETTTAINGNTGGTTISLTANDTLNGNPFTVGNGAGEVTFTLISTLPAGLTLNADRTITVAQNTPKGNYNVEYRICDNNNSGNCDTVTSIVVVTADALIANTDTVPSTAGSNVSQTLGTNVFTNDTKNGSPLNPSDVNLTVTTADPKGYLNLDSNGNVVLGANAPAGDYELTYTICEKLNTSNCSSNTVKVTVTAPIIDAVTETTTAINGNTGGTTISLTANDTLNGNPFTVGNGTGEVTFTLISTLPAGLTLNSDRTITVAQNTPKGNYNVEYRICDNNNSGNCDTVTSIVVVTSDALVANLDTVPSVAGSNTNQTLGTNVFTNDTKNGSPLNPSDVNLTVTTADPKGYLTLDSNGNVVLGANAPAGNYELTYTICEKLNTSNCSSNTVKVTVTAPIIDAVTETTTAINGNTGGTTISLTANDTLNGNPFTVGTASGEVTFTLISTLPAGLTLNADRTITVAQNTPTGNYNVEYRICDNNNSGNCDTVTSIVVVTADALVANLDTVPSTSGSNVSQTLGTNVFTNDTKNGSPLNPSDVNLTVTTADPKGYLTLDTNGNVVLGANAPAGDYELTYTICEKLNNSNCSSNTVKVTVTAPIIDAVTETTTAINGNTGGTTISLTANDTLNGNPFTVGTASGEVTFTLISTLPAGLTLNADRTITVAQNTPKGNYNVEYRICDNNNAGNCDTVISIVVVTADALIANMDTLPSVAGSNTNQTLGTNVFDNDTKNGSPLNASEVNLTVTTADPKGYLTLDSNGNVVLGANAPAGNYELTYTICEKLNISNCSSNTVTVTVKTLIIDAVADPIAYVDGIAGGTTASVISNDTLNGNPVTIGTNLGDVILTLVGTLPNGLTLNADGTVTVAPNTPAGNYNVEYRICEVSNPSNCDSVISLVSVSAETLVANEDIVTTAVGINVPQTVINIFTNDTKNGQPLVPSDVNLTITKADPKGYLILNPDGTVTLNPNAPAGNYELTYTICEKLNTSNCSSNDVKVTVIEPKMTVTAASYCANNVPYVNYSVTPDNFTTTNLLTINWIDSANNVVATQTNLPLSGNILWPGAVVDGSGNGQDWPGWVLNNGQWTQGADGFELTRPAVTMQFVLNPTVNVSVTYPDNQTGCNARPPFSIKANDDNAGPLDVKKDVNAMLNIFTNDILNGIKPNVADVVLTTIIPNPNLILNTDGSISVLQDTPNGEYKLTYQICEAANTSNCSQAVVTVTVVNGTDQTTPSEPLITLTNDAINVDGINGSLEFINVLDNDLLNGLPINPADVTVSPVTINSNFEWNADGTVNVKPNTQGGNYALTYQVCIKGSTTNCATAILNVFVEVPAIALIKTATFNDENQSGYANAGETITYKFTVTNTGNVPLTNIKITDPLTGVIVTGLPLSLAVNESNSTNFLAVYKITQEDINRGKVSNQASVQGQSSRGVVVEDLSDDTSNSGDNPTVLDINGCVIKVFNAFSPNGDAKNARFYIQGLECYPNNTVEIYNRWGVLVFSIDQYNNQDRVFVGYSDGRSTVKQSEGLPVGTYFYILKYKDNDSNPHEKSGYLYINK